MEYDDKKGGVQCLGRGIWVTCKPAKQEVRELKAKLDKIKELVDVDRTHRA
jgi:hypothetical protein